jgi:hypothetical protein
VSGVVDEAIEAPALRLSALNSSRAAEWAVAVRRLLERRHALVALLVYAAVTIFWDRGSVGHLGSMCSCGLPGDPAQQAWAFEWFPYTLLHGLNPLYSHAMWTPTGINLAGANAGPFLGYLAAPVTWLWGTIVAYNLVSMASSVSAAWACYWLCRYITRAPWASMLVGFAYGFSTYEIAELGGHLVLAVIFVPPLVALCVLRAIDGVASRRATVFQLTVLLLAQLGTSTEILFTMTLTGGILLVAGWAFGSSEWRAQTVRVLPWIATAYVITLVLSSWYIYELMKAPAYAKDVGFYGYPTDLLSFVTPNPPTWIGGAKFDAVSGLYVGGAGETLSYIGAPMILLALRFIFTRWDRRLTKALTVTLVLMLLWILGRSLEVAGHPTVWLPYSLIGKLPLFNEVMQGRVALELSLFCAVLLAIWLARPSAGQASRRMFVLRWLCAIVAVAFVVPNFVSHAAFAWTNPTFFQTNMYKQYLKRGETIMPIAWGGFSESPMWQAEDHMYWNMANGYFLYPPPAGWRNQLTADLWADVPTSADGTQLHQFVIQRHVSDVVVQADELARWAPTLKQAGLHPSVTVGGVTIYKVPAAWGAGHKTS